ncbi:hypothetical protein ACL6C3_11775 [Capilliphycus salinus ALCB114379]|uniref:hypothetical protein n=1 Tax=Capilliphycus salinus TaxID=2768948 RepID=UPI0039A63040
MMQTKQVQKFQELIAFAKNPKQKAMYEGLLRDLQAKHQEKHQQSEAQEKLAQKDQSKSP